MSNPVTYLDRPWVEGYKLGPYRLDASVAPLPEVPVYHALYEAAKKYPNQTAIHYMGRDIKYPQLREQVDRLATALSSLGVRKGDRVCVFLPNCIEFVLSDWAILRAGAAIVPTSVLRTDQGLLYEIATSGSRVVICREENLERVMSIKDQAGIEHIIVTSTDGYDLNEVAKALPKGASSFRKLLEVHDPQPPQVTIDPKEDLCELSFTGGATGRPKGVMITHFNRNSCVTQSFSWVMKPLLRGFVGKSSVLIPIPLFHTYGHFVQQSATYLGLRVILLPDSRDTNLFVEYIEKFRPFLIPGVPTQFMRLAEAGLSRLNSMLMSGSAPLPVEVAEMITKKTGMPICEGYGLTETSPLTHFNVSAFSRITGFLPQAKTGIGIPLPETECRLVDLQTGLDVPFGEPGEIILRGPQVMKGYWPEPGSGLAQDGWLHTGDIAVIDEDCYFHLVDRTKDMVNVSGMKVYTTSVDEVLFKHPGVLMAAAIGIPDPEAPGSERVMAVIQLKEEYRGNVTAQEIQSFCKQHLAPYEVPKFVEFREELPLTVTEKVFKKALRDEIIARTNDGQENE